MLHRINNDSLWLNRFFIPGVGIPVSSCRRDTSVSRAETKNTRSLASRLSATWSSSDKNWILLSKCCCFTWSKQTIDDNDFFIHSYIYIFPGMCVYLCLFGLLFSWKDMYTYSRICRFKNMHQFWRMNSGTLSISSSLSDTSHRFCRTKTLGLESRELTLWKKFFSW